MVTFLVRSWFDPNRFFFELIRYHLVRIIDGIRSLCVCKSLVSALLVMLNPALKLHSSRHKQVVKSNGHFLRRSYERTTWSFSKSRTDITVNVCFRCRCPTLLSLIVCKSFCTICRAFASFVSSIIISFCVWCLEFSSFLKPSSILGGHGRFHLFVIFLSSVTFSRKNSPASVYPGSAPLACFPKLWTVWHKSVICFNKSALWIWSSCAVRSISSNPFPDVFIWSHVLLVRHQAAKACLFV